MRFFVLMLSLAAAFPPPAARAEDLTAGFDACEVTGSTTLYDLNRDWRYETDRLEAQRRTLPASTFKVFHSLIALDAGVTNPDEVFKWDGVARAIPVWNQDTRFEDAFKNSTVWVHEALTRRLDKDVYRRALVTAGYEGNADIDHGVDGNFWVYGDWGVSPAEQIAMLVKLYKNELPFSAEAMETVKGFMCEGDTCGKTGWTQKDGLHIGWWIGYRETGRGPLFFATRLLKSTEKEAGDFAACRKTITTNVIEDYLKTVPGL